MTGTRMQLRAGLGLVTCLLVVLCWTPTTTMALDFCPPGKGAGQCAPPVGINSLRGLAVDNETGRIYVADRNNNRVEVFEGNGTFLFAFGWGVADGTTAALQTCGPGASPPTATCFEGKDGSGAGQFDHPGRIAVDNDPTSPTQHAVYVAEDFNHRVQKFNASGAFLLSVGSSGEAEGQFTTGIFPGVGPGGVLYALDNPPLGNNQFKHRLQRFEPNGTPIAPQCFVPEPPIKGKATGLAVEAVGNFWVANENDGNAIRKYDAGCGPLLGGGEVDPGLATKFLAIDEGGTFFAQQIEGEDSGSGNYQVIATYGSSGTTLRRFGYDQIPLSFPSAPEGLAATPAGPLLSLGEAGIKLFVEPPPGPIIPPLSAEASSGSVWAAIGAEINPEGKASEYEVQYVDKHSYETESGFASPKTRSSGKLVLANTDFSVHAIEAIAGCKPFTQQALDEGKCLEPETKYRYRIKALNADGEDEVEGELETLRPMEVEALYASAPGADGITLNAEVNPLGSAAKGYFQYIDEGGYETGIAAAEKEGKSRQEAEEEGRGFEGAAKIPDENVGESRIDFGSGEDTVRRGVSLYPLSPGTTYHYRLIAEDNFATQASEERRFQTFHNQRAEPGSCPANEAFRIGPGALLPDCRAYELVSPLDKGGGDIRVLGAPLGGDAVLEQSADSGNRLAYGSVRAFGDAASAPWTSQYIAQRIKGEEWRTHSINSPRGEPLLGGNGQFDTEFRFFSPELCDTWQITFAESPPESPLAPGSVPGVTNLYRRSDRLCGPEGYEALAPLTAQSGLGSDIGLELQGVSVNGEHAIFRSSAKLSNDGKKGTSQLYESVRGEGLRLVCVLPGGGPLSKACTAGNLFTTGRTDTRHTSVSGAISDDGERIYWSEAGAGEGALYLRIEGNQTVAVSEAAEGAAGTSGSFFWGASGNGGKAIFTTGGRLYEFTLGGSSELLAEGVVGVMGMSEDASRVYFASNKVLPESGQNSEGDEATADTLNLYLHEGGGNAFIATLAAGDLSADFASPLAREPINRIARVSADGEVAAFISLAAPTGYDNANVEDGEATKELYLYDATANGGEGELLCASCNPSGARPTADAANFAARIPGYENQMHAARALPDDGHRLYFESADKLAAGDTNGKIDVYQWEAPGAGTCKTSSASFSTQNEGCVNLISSGQSPLDSRFVEASPDGHDAFFATVGSLLPQDYGLIDIYDARAGGGLPVPAVPAPPCEGDSCHNPPASPVQPTPSSSGDVGPNPAQKKPPRRCPKGKKAKKMKGKTRCVPKQKKKHQKPSAGR